MQFNGGQGGNGLDDEVTDVRIMGPTKEFPGGRVNYGKRQANGGWQAVHPYTGASLSKDDAWWHIPITTQPPF